MKNFINSCLVFAIIVSLGQVQAQVISVHPNMGMVRRYQQMQQQQAKQYQQMEKAYIEYCKKEQEAYIKRQIELKAEIAKRHERLEAEKAARIEKNKQHNAEMAAKGLVRPSVEKKIGD